MYGSIIKSRCIINKEVIIHFVLNEFMMWCILDRIKKNVVIINKKNEIDK